MSDEPEIREYEQSNGMRVREVCWHFGTDNEHFEHAYQHKCPQCRLHWWSGDHPTTLIVICPACITAQSRQEEELAERNRQVGKRLFWVRSLILFCVGGFFLSCVAAALCGLIARLFNFNLT